MKYIIILALLFLASSSQAQIKLEHTYLFPGNYNYPNLQSALVDSGEYKYFFCNNKDTLLIFNIDHTLDRRIVFHLDDSLPGFYTEYLTKRLFDLDDQYEFIVEPSNIPGVVRIFKEDGTVAFGCENCGAPSVIATDQGAKMLVDYWNNGQIQTSVFSLPGKLPTDCAAKSSISNGVGIAGKNSSPPSAYPNPSSGLIHIAYELPEGSSSGKIVICDIKGKEIKEYKVGNIFKDILIEKSELPSGSYFYKVVTEKGQSEVKKLVIVK